MKAAEKAKAQKIIDKIQDGRFDENDIDNIFMRLRAYSGEYRVFREVADFVAHNDVRKKGITSASLEAFHLSFKYIIDYDVKKKTLDVSKPIPLYIKKMMKYQADKFSEELWTKFNVTPEELKSRIDKYFKDDKKAKTTQLQRLKDGSPEDFAPIRHLFEYVRVEPAFDAASLMQDLLGVLTWNKLVFQESAVIAQQPAIILCVMLLMHQTKFEFDDDMKGECRISTEHLDLKVGQPFSGFGGLQVRGSVNVLHPEGMTFPLEFSIFESGLQAEEYCDVSLLLQHNAQADFSERLVRVDLERELILLDGNRLGPIAEE